MSTIKVTNLSGRGGASPNLPDGANVTGVVTATGFVGSGANLTGLANTDFINAEQVTVVGVVTAGTGNIGNVNITKSAAGAGATVGSFTGVTTYYGAYYGSGSGLTGVGETIAPWHYNPDINDVHTGKNIGIGLTFNKKILAGSGTATMKICNAGVAGTTIQSWGISSTTIGVTDLTLGALVSPIIALQTYQVDIPSGFVVDSNETSYVGTAWTFTATVEQGKVWTWGNGANGASGLNSETEYSSPVQLPGTTWSSLSNVAYTSYDMGAHRDDGTLWMWGRNNYGQLGLNDKTSRSSPVQLPGTTWATSASSVGSFAATKTDGTLWSMGDEDSGMLGQNDGTRRSSPTQIPGTTWGTSQGKIVGGYSNYYAVKTDGTLWSWGSNTQGQLGHNNKTSYSSPKQIPGTSWAVSYADTNKSAHIRTDGTMWMLGKGHWGSLGLNNTLQYSSPVQVPGTSWAHGALGDDNGMAVKTDGTLWVWGVNSGGQLGQNSTQPYSSPVQIPGTYSTSWGSVDMTNSVFFACKADGTLWGWGSQPSGILGQNNEVQYSSPIQIASASGTNFTNVKAAYAIHAMDMS